jgi:hypothetical protein
VSSYIGTGTTVVFGTSGFSADIIDLTPPGWSRESIDTSHKGTADNAKTFKGSLLTDYGEMVMECAFNPATTPPMTSGNAAETITITFPDSGAATWAFSGFMVGYEPSEPLEDRATVTVTVKVTGKVTISP